MTEAMWVFPAGSKVDVILPDGTHRYWSTWCRHDRHRDCASTVLVSKNPYGPGDAAIERTPAQCKHCQAPCLCSCHKPTEEKTRG